MKHQKTGTAFRLALCLLCLALLAGCAKQEAEVVSVPAESAQPAAAAAAAAPSLVEQRELLEAKRERWAFTEAYESPWFYTFVDLDRNGRQEVIAACTQGSGLFTYAHYWEVTPDYGDIRKVYHENTEIEGPDDWPEIVRDSLESWYDKAADRYYYPCEGVTRSGMAHQYYAWYALCLKDGVAEWERLADKSVDWDEAGGERVECHDAQGQPISEAEYDGAVAARFAGMEQGSYRLEWTKVENEANEPLSASPAAAEPPVSTPAPAVGGDPGVKVTKNPSSEALAIGGRTWFIAHADNGAAPTWLLQSPDSRSYTLAQAMEAHPGLRLEALAQDTLAVSDVPLSLNGWSVIARFDGLNGSVLTEPASIYVGDFVASYAGVIDGYRKAYAQGRSGDPGYLWDNSLSELCAYYAGVGYALKDLDKDGVPELVIAGLSPSDPLFKNCVCDVYTLDGGYPLRVAVSQARQRYYLRTDSLLYWEGSSGAAYSHFAVEKLRGAALEPVETLFTDLTAEGKPAWFSRQGGLEGADATNSTALSEAQFQARVQELESLVYLPALTAIR